MTTQALQPSLAARPEDFYRRRLQAVILALLAVSMMFMLYYGPGQFRGVQGGWWIEAAFNILLHPVLLLIIWWRLRSPHVRIPLGFALGYAGSAVWTILRSALGPALSLQGQLRITLYQMVIFVLYVAMLGLAARLIQLQKSRRELALVGIPIGLFYMPAATAVVKPVVDVLKFIHGGY